MERLISLDKKAHCTDLIHFHQWRQEKISHLLRTMDKSLFEKELNGSFASLLIIFSHLVWAEKIWLGRVQPDSVAVMRNTTPEQLLNEWSGSTDLWVEMVENATPEEFYREVKYHSTNREEFTNTVFEIVTHMVDHSTYHIGQMMNAIRSFGVEPISTNYIHYLRDKKKSS